jgi:STE24 endopeptidase
VKVGEVYVVDASRRTTAANAYVTGLGSTKRVVLYDNLIDNFSRDETRLVVAHELAHVKHSDVPRGLLFVALVAPLGLLAVFRLTGRMAPPGPAAVPALALSIVLVATPVTWISNQLSRRIEARADSTSLTLTRAPDAFVSFHRRLALRNVSDPDPPDITRALLGTHPSTMQRIGIARAYEQGVR